MAYEWARHTATTSGDASTLLIHFTNDYRYRAIETLNHLLRPLH